MAFQPVPDTARVYVRWIGNAQPAAWRWHFTAAAPYTQADLDTLTGGIDAVIHTIFKPIISTNYVYTETYARGLNTEFDLESTSSANAGSGGNGAGTNLTNQTSFVASLRTGFTGRSARGRCYALGLRNGDSASPRQASSTYVANWVDALADMIDAIDALGWAMSIVQFFSDGAPLPTGVPRLVTEVLASNLNLDTQRRRVGK